MDKTSRGTCLAVKGQGKEKWGGRTRRGYQLGSDALRREEGPAREREGGYYAVWMARRGCEVQAARYPPPGAAAWSPTTATRRETDTEGQRANRGGDGSHTGFALRPRGGLPGHDEGGDHDDVEAESLSTTVVKVHRCCGG